MTTPPITALDREAAALLPCPFCGGEAALYEGRASCVECAECGAGCASTDLGPSAAIAAWNTRTAAERATSPAGDAGEVERIARACCDDAEARFYADAGEAPFYDDSSGHVQAYWQCVATAAIAALLPQAGDADVVGEPGA